MLFDATQVPEPEGFGVIPKGVYHVAIENAEEMPTKAGDGSYIKVRFRLEGPTHVNRCVFFNYTWRNPSEVAQRIGHQQLGQLCRAVGRPHVRAWSELVGGRCKARLGVEQRPGRDEENTVLETAPHGEGSAMPAQARPAASPAMGSDDVPF